MPCASTIRRISTTCWHWRASCISTSSRPARAPCSGNASNACACARSRPRRRSPTPFSAARPRVRNPPPPIPSSSSELSVTVQRYGVTEEMIASYGDLVFRLSNNIQLRRGDPVRLKQFEVIERERADLGMSDAQIGAMIGLSPEQARTIRIIVEHRRFRTHHHQRILGLGAGRRYREERYVSPQQRFATSPEAEHLRQAVRFPPAHPGQMLEQGIWNGDTV